jgi:hypothetical protein|uniref:Uncharacterized protein n=1 Tax=Myoviridae sp. ctshb19 TaxID=2825194 RepID=A0A8S5UH10_9CAUD|nr:MAG TPA: hypothetical protein [Myoviridae sp. ctshb19]
MAPFIKNNIRFRSVAACSLKHFYDAKAYMLDVVINEQNQFSEVAKETLLLLFNSYSKWATDVESIFLNRPTLTRQEIDQTLDAEQALQLRHRVIFEEHTDLFTPKFIEVWWQVNAHTRKAFQTLIRSTQGQSHLEAYPIIMSALGSTLQNCMYELYEIDCLLGGDFVEDRCSTNRSNTNRMVVYVDNFALDYFYKTGVFMCEERIRYYNTIACRRLPTLVKNHSTCNLRYTGVIEGDEPLATLLNRCAEYVDIIDIETP